MRLINLDYHDLDRFKDAVADTAEALNAGRTIVYPTDTIYGLGCDALNPQAVEQIIRIKGLARQKPFSIMVGDVAEIGKYAELSEKNQAIVGKFLPGPFTFILPKLRTIPDIVTNGEKYIGIRIPDHPLTHSLLEAFAKPIVTTSVNPTGEEPLNDPFKIVDLFQRRAPYPDLILDGGRIKDGKPSTVIDLSGQIPRIIRANIMSTKETLEILARLS